MQSFSTFCEAIRSKANGEAARFLSEAGFTASRSGEWRGSISAADGRTADIVLTLPDGFPDHLPLVRVLTRGGGGVRPHVDPDGNLCLGPTDGLLLDTSDARRLVRDSLARVRAVLFPPAETEIHEAETEFNAYWRWSTDGSILSIVTPGDFCGEIWVATVAHDIFDEVIAGSREQLKRWTGAMRVPVSKVKPGYFIGLSGLPTLPEPGQPVTLANLLELIAKGNGPEAQKAFQTWLSRQRFPVTVLFSGKMSAADDEAVFASVIPVPSGDVLTRVQRGFRPGHYPGWRLLACARKEPVLRPVVARADPRFALPRGGAMAALATKKVVVFGCGAVGSHLASLLLSGGVGKLVLVDKERLAAENLYRHLLGASSIGEHKAIALRDALLQRFPDAAISALVKPIEMALGDDLDELMDADLVVVALGDETLERRLDQYLGSRMPRVHVWLEPLGLGGHVLSCAGDRNGCLHCLYRADEQFGLVSMAALAAPGQTFRRAIGGCAGTFTPFGATDAVRAAVEAARESIRLLSGGVTSRLVSWVGECTAFEAAGFQVTARCRSIGEGMTRIEERFAQPDCGSCGSAAA